jgi:hypothetical protein
MRKAMPSAIFRIKETKLAIAYNLKKTVIRMKKTNTTGVQNITIFSRRSIGTKAILKSIIGVMMKIPIDTVVLIISITEIYTSGLFCRKL